MLNLMRKPCGLLLSAALFGCGGGSDGSSSLATSGAGEPGSERVSLPPDPGAAPTPEVLDLSAPDTDLREAVPGPEATPASGTPVPSRCLPPAGVSGSPRNVEQAVLLMNSLPRPTTLECFIESLDRPLELYLTSSNLSLQPADGARSPRTFIVQGALVLSVVGNREFSSLLEIGYQSSKGRSMKGEVKFPIVADVTASSILQRISIGTVSICGGCHGAETRPDDSFFVDGAFESAVAVPLAPFEVSLDTLREAAASCQPASEPARCGVLSALLDHGEVKRSNLWGPSSR